MARLHVLGSGAGGSSAARANSSLALEVDGALYVLDCGEGCSNGLLRSKLDPLRIRKVFISHAHVDHLIGVFQLIQSLHLLRRTDELEVFLPRETREAVRLMMETLFLVPEKLPFLVKLTDLGAGAVYRDDLVALRPMFNDHLEALYRSGDPASVRRTWRLESFSFSVEAHGRVLLYTSDIKDPSLLLPELARADVVVTELSHVDLDSLLEGLSEARLRTLVITHVHTGLEQTKDEVVSRVKKHLGDLEVLIAYDGMRLNI